VIKAAMIETLRESAVRRQVCNVYFWYDRHYWNLIPLALGEELFLSAEEDDFVLDGYTIRRFCDLDDVVAKDDKCTEILQKEGVLDALQTPPVGVASWEAAFKDLQRLGGNVIVEAERPDADESDFIIGRIEIVLKQSVFVRHFDADCVWQERPEKIYYGDITSVTFASRYVRIFSKYLDEPPKAAVLLNLKQAD
jgi:hypothetical protein